MITDGNCDSQMTTAAVGDSPKPTEEPNLDMLNQPSAALLERYFGTEYEFSANHSGSQYGDITTLGVNSQSAYLAELEAEIEERKKTADGFLVGTEAVPEAAAPVEGAGVDAVEGETVANDKKGQGEGNDTDDEDAEDRNPTASLIDRVLRYARETSVTPFNPTGLTAPYWSKFQTNDSKLTHTGVFKNSSKGQFEAFVGEVRSLYNDHNTLVEAMRTLTTTLGENYNQVLKNPQYFVPSSVLMDNEFKKENVALKAEMNRYKTAYETLVAEKAASSITGEPPTRDEALESKTKELETDKATLEREKSDLEKANATLTKNLATTEKRLNKFTSTGSIQTQRIDTLEEDKKSLTAKVTELEKKLADTLLGGVASGAGQPSEYVEDMLVSMTDEFLEIYELVSQLPIDPENAFAALSSDEKLIEVVTKTKKAVKTFVEGTNPCKEFKEVLGKLRTDTFEIQDDKKYYVLYGAAKTHLGLVKTAVAKFDPIMANAVKDMNQAKAPALKTAWKQFKETTSIDFLDVFGGVYETIKGNLWPEAKTTGKRVRQTDDDSDDDTPTRKRSDKK